jgi:hypothetical protein|tara:strand:+ start:303 stop:659 length:357 start_codon:yes stop_codon:yes gene_type:complete
MYKKDSETAVTTESTYTTSTRSNSEDDVILKVHTRTVNGAPAVVTLELSADAGQARRFVNVDRTNLLSLRDMFNEVVHDMEALDAAAEDAARVARAHDVRRARRCTDGFHDDDCAHRL